jgi:hypothetical protein
MKEARKMTRMANVLLLLGAAVGIVAALGEPVFAQPSNLKLGGAGWFQYGRIEKSSDTLENRNYNGSGLLASGAQALVEVDINDKLEIQVGLGVASYHNVSGSKTVQGGYAPMFVSPYLAQAQLKYTAFKEEASELVLRGGLFDYDYATENQNLGLYLLRGPLRPGYVLSGFETKHVLPVANTFGAQIHYLRGGWSNDLLMTFETEFNPYYDISFAYVTSYQFGRLLRVGAGGNYYHAIPITDNITHNKRWIYVDTLTQDTTRISFAGIKLMGNFSLDLKALFSDDGPFGPEDLKLYGEVALFGLENTKAYQEIYGSYAKRMPVMMGFNLPAMGHLDRLAFEIEWYGAEFKDDLGGYNHTASNTPSPLPYSLSPGGYAADKFTRDNVKWSLYGSRTFAKHVKVSLQVANDHYRPGVFTGYGDNAPAGSQVLTVTPSDWYWMSKIAYFF